MRFGQKVLYMAIMKILIQLLLKEDVQLMVLHVSAVYDLLSFCLRKNV